MEQQKCNRLIICVVALMLILLGPAPAFSQKYTTTQKDSILYKIRKTVSENYIITDKALIIKDSLLPDKFAGIDSVKPFLHKINDLLYLWAHDKHLSVKYDSAFATNLTDHKYLYATQEEKEKKENYGFEKTLILDHNIGYIKMNYFADAKNARETFLKAISEVKNTDGLILDLRNNLGGSGSMIQLVASAFLLPKNSVLLNINYKDRFVAMKTVPLADSVAYRTKPLVVLCSDQTYSAGEAVTFILKNRKRATVIGSTTAGAGNVAGPYSVDNRIVITIPVGIIRDPELHTAYEQVGVTPDIVSENDNAIDLAKKAIMKN